MPRNYVSIEQPDRAATVDILNTPEHLGAQVRVVVEGGKLRVEVKAFTGPSTWMDHEIEVDLAENEPPAIEDLPEEQREPFMEWLNGQTVPVREDGRAAYFPSDYNRWAQGLDVID